VFTIPLSDVNEMLNQQKLVVYVYFANLQGSFGDPIVEKHINHLKLNCKTGHPQVVITI